MFTQTLVAAFAVSAVSAIELFPGHQGMRRELQARQTATDATYYSDYQACATAIELYDSLPTAPTDVVSYLETASIDVDACKVTFPPSISSELKVYETEISEWYAGKSAVIESALSKCPEFSSNFYRADETATYPDDCATATSSATTATSADDDSDATATDTTATATATSVDNDSDATATGTTATAIATGTTTTAAAATTTTSAAGTTEPTTPAGKTAAATTASASVNAGPRETACLGAAVAAAVGFLGLAVAL